MARHYAPISVKELELRLISSISKKEHLQAESYKTLSDIFDDDFGAGESVLYNLVVEDIKVEFDCENMTIDPKDEDDKSMKSMIGFCSVGDFSFFGLYAGGDWESPVYFILYWDGKRIRGYVPTEGNVFNAKTKLAYGNGDDDDMIKVPNFDPAKLRQDILDRIQKKEKAPVILISKTIRRLNK